MYTFDNGGNTLELPNPDLGDARRISHNDAVTSNRTGELLNLVDRQVTKDTMSMTFSKVRGTKVTEAKTYFQTYLGQAFTITDHNARVFTAVITSTDLEIIAVKDTCSYTFNLEILEI
jgi:hypothetical protein